MRTVHVEQVIVGHYPSWGKWPDTDDEDYSDVMAKRMEWGFNLDGVRLEITNRWLPAYRCYLDAGREREGIRPVFPWINNLDLPHDEVVLAQISALEDAAAAGCTSLLWEHSYQCAPSAAGNARRLFPLTILSFGDDLFPGSSDVKTWPVAGAFDAAMLAMMVCNFEQGVLTAPEYLKRGTGKVYHVGCSLTAGLQSELARTGFDLHEKADRIRMGWTPPTDVAFAGIGIGEARRVDFLQALSKEPEVGGELGVTRLHGPHMRDSIIGTFSHDEAMGAGVAGLYTNAAMSPNPQQSSLFNCRLVDLWRCGVVQFIHDPWKELEYYGITTDAYVPFDGTLPGFKVAVAEFRARGREAWADLLLAAEQACNHYTEAASWTGAYTRMYQDHLPQLESRHR